MRNKEYRRIERFITWIDREDNETIVMIIYFATTLVLIAFVLWISRGIEEVAGHPRYKIIEAAGERWLSTSIIIGVMYIGYRLAALNWKFAIVILIIIIFVISYITADVMSPRMDGLSTIFVEWSTYDTSIMLRERVWTAVITLSFPAIAGLLIGLLRKHAAQVQSPTH